MADYIPHKKPGEAITLTASADVTGQRLVVVSGVNTVAPSGADAANVIGVAGYDVKSGEKVTIFTRAGGVHPLIASGAIAAGVKVVSATLGRVQTIASLTNPIGIALQSAAADGDVIDVLFL